MTTPPPSTQSLAHTSTHRRERFAAKFTDLCQQINAARNTRAYPLYQVISADEHNFCSNDYLGLRTDPRVIAAAQTAIASNGVSSCASPLVGGTTDLHTALQRDLAGFLGTQQVQLTPSGYQANLAAIAGLLQPGDLLLCDQYSHASVIDGGRLAGAEIRTFRHNRTDHLATVLAAQPTGRRILVVTEGAFSADGDLGRVREICDVAHRHDALVCVDEAHSFGVHGPGGRGLAHHDGVAADVDLLVGTMSKALGSTGGFIGGDLRLLEIVRHNARALLFSAALSPASVGAAARALHILRTEPRRRERLWRNTHRMRNGLHEAGLDTMNSETPVIPVLIGDQHRTLVLTEALQRAGIHVTAGVYPMVAPHRSRLRMHVTATHSPDAIDHAIHMVTELSTQHQDISPATDNTGFENRSPVSVTPTLSA